MRKCLATRTELGEGILAVASYVCLLPVPVFSSPPSNTYTVCLPHCELLLPKPTQTLAIPLHPEKHPYLETHVHLSPQTHTLLL